MSIGVMLFNPFTGKPRHPSDIESDPKGILVWDGEEPLRAYSPPAQQEPVAWRWSESNGQRWFDWTTDWSHHDKAKSMGVPIEYAYTSTPAQRKPLTDEGIEELFADGLGFEHHTIIVRKIEAAHGIKENT